MDEQKQALSDEVNIITHEPTNFVLDVIPKSRLHRLLIKLKIKPAKYSFPLTPLLVANLYRVSERIMSLPNILEEQDERSDVYKMIFNHLPVLLEVVALTIRNDDKPVDKHLVEILKQNLTAEEMLAAFKIVSGQLNLESFLSTMIIAKGMQILKPKISPMSEEIIASQN